MTTSGTYLWDPELADLVDEAFERAKVDPATIAIGHILSARRSMRFMLTQWASDDFYSFRIDRVTVPLIQGVQTFPIDPDTDGRIIDILQVAFTRDGTDTSIYPMSRQEWLDIPDKNTEGRVNRYFADKRRDLIEMSVWPVPENSTDVLLMDVARKFEDAAGAAETLDLSYYMREAFAAGLAARLNVKFGQDARQIYLDQSAKDTYHDALMAQRELGDLVIVPSAPFRRRTGGRQRA